MLKRLKISQEDWIFGIGAFLLLYFLLSFGGVNLTMIGWISLFAYSIFTCVIVMPLSEAIYPDTEKNAWQNRKGFILLYAFVSAMILLFVWEVYFD